MKPIIFSTPMVQAILAGRKTQTRRIVKPQPSSGIRKSVFVKSGLEDGHGREIKPRYQPSDILWVRETCCEVPYEYNHVPIKGGYITIPKYAYKADSERDYTGIWKPSIHMPREAARIFLRVTSVRVERLQEITAEDVIREGIEYSDSGPYHWHVLDTKLNAWINFHFHDEAFKHLWDSLNAKRGYGWDTNPWVWVIEFERISRTGGE